MRAHAMRTHEIRVRMPALHVRTYAIRMRCRALRVRTHGNAILMAE